MSKQTVTKKEVYGFDYVFTEDELKEKSSQLAKACGERNELEDSKKSTMSDFKAKIDSRNAEINIISNHINTGKTWVQKSCEAEYDFDRGVKTFYHEGVLVGQEKLKPSDYQQQIELQ